MPCKKNSAAALILAGLACQPSHADEDNTLMPKKQIQIASAFWLNPGVCRAGITGVFPPKEGKMPRMWLVAVCAVMLLVVMDSRPAASEVPEGIWLLANRVAVEVFDCSGLLCGRIVWLTRPRTPEGQPGLDHLNPDPSLRQRHLCGLTIIWGLQPDSPGHWSSGWLYDPQDGVTYDVTAELTAPNMMSARVYRGVPLFGRTEILIRDPQLSFDGRC